MDPFKLEIFQTRVIYFVHITKCRSERALLRNSFSTTLRNVLGVHSYMSEVKGIFYNIVMNGVLRI